MIELAENRYGKSRVRLMKVTRHDHGHDEQTDEACGGAAHGFATDVVVTPVAALSRVTCRS